mgnify:CR=1 FL=1|jgi:large subunit ribosomal protein L29
MKTEDMTGKTPDELKKMLLELRKDQMNQRFQKTAGQLTNTSLVRKLRRTIASVKTALNAPAVVAPKAKKTPAKKAAPKKTAKKAA